MCKIVDFDDFILYICALKFFYCLLKCIAGHYHYNFDLLRGMGGYPELVRGFLIY